MRDVGRSLRQAARPTPTALAGAREDATRRPLGRTPSRRGAAAGPLRPGLALRSCPTGSIADAGAVLRRAAPRRVVQAAGRGRPLEHRPPAGTAARDGPGRPRRAAEPARLRARQPGQPGRGGPAAVPRSPRRRRPQAVPARQRPAGLAQAIAEPRQSAHRAGDGQPGLACTTSARGWSARPATSAPAASRRATRSCSTGWRGRFMRRAAGRSRRCTG